MDAVIACGTAILDASQTLRNIIRLHTGYHTTCSVFVTFCVLMPHIAVGKFKFLKCLEHFFMWMTIWVSGANCNY